mmetsp:Transcript_11350/g.40964  ORF Transcript_11350/g.40964 Transcript_11350/m.40964 type:complete len:80 (+) Transcript_11350:2153-2392(+)
MHASTCQQAGKPFIARLIRPCTVSRFHRIFCIARVCEMLQAIMLAGLRDNFARQLIMRTSLIWCFVLFHKPELWWQVDI